MGNLKASVGPDTVHLCLDMQRLFGPSGPWATPWMTRVLPTVVKLVECAPSRTVFTCLLLLRRHTKLAVCGALILKNGRQSRATISILIYWG